MAIYYVSWRCILEQKEWAWVEAANEDEAKVKARDGDCIEEYEEVLPDRMELKGFSANRVAEFGDMPSGGVSGHFGCVAGEPGSFCACGRCEIVAKQREANREKDPHSGSVSVISGNSIAHTGVSGQVNSSYCGPTGGPFGSNKTAR